MTILKALFSLICLLNGILFLLPKGFSKRKEKLSQQFGEFCSKVESLNDDELTLALKRPILWLAFSLLVLAFLLSHALGESDQDVKEISAVSLGTFFFCQLSLIPSKKILNRIDEIIKFSLKGTIWIGFIAAVMVFIVVFFKTSFIPYLNKQLPNPELVTTWTTELASPLATYLSQGFIIGLVTTLVALVGIPFIANKMILLFVRKLAPIILEKTDKDPLKLPLWIISLIITFVSLIIYFHDKIAL